MRRFDPRGSVVALAALVVAVGALATSTATSTATSAAPAGQDGVSHAEYRAVHRGMKPVDVARATHDATFHRTDVGRCTLRIYHGWDDEHDGVGILFDDRRRVADKQTWSKDDAGWFFAC